MKQLHPYKIGKKVLWFDSVTSTNTKAVEIMLREHKAHGIVVVADEQTHGRGRVNRKWISPRDGGVWCSIIIKLENKKDVLLYTQAASLTVVRLLEFYGIRAQLRWPNDVYVMKKKIGGVLLEVHSKQHDEKFLIVGIGLNVNFSEDSTPDYLKMKMTDMHRLLNNAPKPDRKEVLQKLLEIFSSYCHFISSGDRQRVIKEWKDNIVLERKEIKIVIGKRCIMGKPVTLRDDGGLVIEARNGAREIVHAGEVFFEA
ncbi:biotin--[acetyl-CoA-carboxylase] ligase [PVC group bacterium]|nr:biotin--[acetyl-CoA-carboxylase] ligase [PVC group bacterium]